MLSTAIFTSLNLSWKGCTVLYEINNFTSTKATSKSLKKLANDVAVTQQTKFDPNNKVWNMKIFICLSAATQFMHCYELHWGWLVTKL